MSKRGGEPLPGLKLRPLEIQTWPESGLRAGWWT
jgi:hypothetical protein